VQALLNDDAFQKMLEPATQNFLRELIGLPKLAPPAPAPVVEPVIVPVVEPVVVKPPEPVVVKAPEPVVVKPPEPVKPAFVVEPVVVKPAVVEAKPVDKPVVVKLVADKNDPAVQATAQLKELIKTNELKNWYDAVIGAVDNPALKAEAEALFAKLPVVRPGLAAEELVKMGLWTSVPKGIAEMQKSARYLPGRQVLVETTCFAKVPERSDVTYEQQRRKIGSYDPEGVKAVTYRGVLKGEDPKDTNRFIVAVDGPDGSPIDVSVTKQSIFTHNQPHQLESRYIHSDTKRDLPYNWESWQMDYAEPLARAKLCEIALKMDDFVQKLDFAHEKVESHGTTVFGRGDVAGKMVDLQKKCVEVVFRSINMKYPREDGQDFTDPGRAGRAIRDVARQAIKGTGMCVQQSTVFGGLMTPFMDMLGVDGQYRSGNCFRNIRGATNNVYAPDNASGHGWWQVTFRPSMEMTVTDRTWDQVNLTLDRAYGFPYGDRYANMNITGFTPKATSATDVNVTGDVTVATMERQFSQAGDGRENHISISQNDSDH
jgi:hypothetical protein